ESCRRAIKLLRGLLAASSTVFAFYHLDRPPRFAWSHARQRRVCRRGFFLTAQSLEQGHDSTTELEILSLSELGVARRLQRALELPDRVRDLPQYSPCHRPRGSRERAGQGRQVTLVPCHIDRTHPPLPSSIGGARRKVA